MNHNSICILGGTGFVGSQIACRLATQGRTVRILTRSRERHKQLLVVPGISLVEMDIFDRQQPNRQLKNVDAVINLVGILNEKVLAFEKFMLIYPSTL